MSPNRDSTATAFLADALQRTQRFMTDAPALALIPVLLAVATVAAVFVAAHSVPFGSGLLLAIILLAGAVAAAIIDRMAATYNTWSLYVHPSGKTVLSMSAQTQGQGHDTTFAEIVAEELGINPDDITVRHGNRQDA